MATMTTTYSVTEAYNLSIPRPSSSGRSKTWAPYTLSMPTTRPIFTRSTTNNASTSPNRPQHSDPHTSSYHTTTSPLSPGWYTANETHNSLDAIAARLNTFASRFERFLGLCATNIVMALFRPTPLVIFLFHPLLLMIFAVVGCVWLVSR